MNYALLVFTIVSLTVLLAFQASSPASADVVSPSKQVKIGIDQTDIICKSYLVKVYRINADSVACFTPSTAEKLVKMGIAKDIPKEKLELKKSFRQNSPVGTVTGLDTVKKYGSDGKVSTNPRVIEYLHVFEVCALDKIIRAPEILVTSDSESKTVKLAKQILPNTCHTNSALIKATTPASIFASITNKGMITDKLMELETKIGNIQEKLSVLKKSFSNIISGEPAPLDDDSKTTISSTGDEIVKLRKELNLAKGELNKYLYTLHSPQLPPSQFEKQKLTFTGMPLEDTSTKILTVSKQSTGNADKSNTGGKNLFNVIFEVCSGKDVLRAPEVRITSDSEEKIIRLAERIVSNSCQMSTGKINAIDTHSITLQVANRGDISYKITELEANISSRLDEQVKHQTELNELVALSEKPVNYEQKVTELSNKIIKLRDEIKDIKFELHGSLYDIYKKQ